MHLGVGGCVSDELKGSPIAHGAAHCDGTPVPEVTVLGGVGSSWNGVRVLGQRLLILWECYGIAPRSAADFH